MVRMFGGLFAGASCVRNVENQESDKGKGMISGESSPPQLHPAYSHIAISIGVRIGRNVHVDAFAPPRSDLPLTGVC